MMSLQIKTEPSAVAPGQTPINVPKTEIDPALPRSVLYVATRLYLVAATAK
jgi:hypothetical protein